MKSDLAFFVTQIIGALAVVISLINLGIEIRKSRKQSIRESMDMITKERGEFIKVLATDEDLAIIMAKGLMKNEDMNDIERFRFASYLYHLFVHWELAYRKWARGNIDDELWTSFVEAIQWWLKKPKVVNWWHYNDIGGFTESFKQFVDKLIFELEKKTTEEES
jgi:hypothetical protein